MGKQTELEPNLTLHLLLFPPFLAEVYEFHRRQRLCCKLRMQIALLGLVTTALWAGLLTLLLLWREDIPSPVWPPFVLPPDPHSDLREPNPPLGAQFPHRVSHLVPAGHFSCALLHSQEATPLALAQHPPHLPPFGHLPHDIPKGAISRWQVEGGRGT